MTSSKYDLNFPIETSRVLDTIDDSPQQTFRAKLKDHQRQLLKYFNPTTPNRGMMLFHGVGSGKTISAIAISKAFVESGTKVVVFVPGNQLQSNFNLELKKTFSKEDYERLVPMYDFIRYSGSGLRKEKLDHLSSMKYLDDKLVIVDEAHNVINMIANSLKEGSSSVVGSGLHKLFLNGENTRFLFLTATPILNSSKELAIALNILNGPIKTITFNVDSKDDDETVRGKLLKFPFVEYVNVSESRVTVTPTPKGFARHDTKLELHETSPDSIVIWLRKFEYFLSNNGYNVGIDKMEINDKNELLPLDNTLFETFIDENFSMKNTELFSRRISGLISSDKVIISPTKNETKILTQRNYPKTIIHPFQRVPMTIEQFTQYSSERRKEIRDDAKKATRATSRAEVLDDTTTMRARSRAICNFAFPGNVLAETSNTTELLDTLQAHFEAIPDNRIDAEFEKLSGKYSRILNHVMTHHGTHVIYSHLKNREGIFALIEFFKRAGFKGFNLHSVDDTPKYAVYDGSNESELIRSIFNNELSDDVESIVNGKTNLHGDIIKLLFISKTGAEGITLKNVRHLHIIEPHWNEVRMDQVIGRVSRFNSHAQLPEDDRTVEVHRYITTFDGLEDAIQSKQILDDILKLKASDRDTTSDEHVIQVAFKKKKIADEILKIMRNSSIDCSLNYANTGQCRLEYIHAKNSIPFVPNFDENVKLTKKPKSNIAPPKEVRLRRIKKIPKRNWIPSKFHEKTVFIDTNSFEAYEKIDEGFKPLHFKLNLKEKLFMLV